MAQLILVTGATRSGKSEWAETLARRSGLPVVYVATAQGNPQDAEWQDRILRHQQRRPRDWTTLHVPLDLATTLLHSTESQCLLIDSLGTWLANWIDTDDRTWVAIVDQLLTALDQTLSTVIIVAEETGWGVVPAYPLGRTFRDRLGHLTRTIAIQANPAYLVVAGFALNLTQLGTPVLSFPDQTL